MKAHELASILMKAKDYDVIGVYSVSKDGESLFYRKGNLIIEGVDIATKTFVLSIDILKEDRK